MIHVFGTALVWLAIVPTARAADDFDELKHQFDNDPKEALDVKEVLLYERDGAKVYDVTYTSPTGGPRDGLPGRAGRQGAACQAPRLCRHGYGVQSPRCCSCLPTTSSCSTARRWSATPPPRPEPRP